MVSLAKNLLDEIKEMDEEFGRGTSIGNIKEFREVLLSHLMKLFALNKTIEWERSTRGWIDGTISRNIGIMFIPNTKNNISLEREDFYNGIMSSQIQSCLMSILGQLR